MIRERSCPLSSSGQRFVSQKVITIVIVIIIVVIIIAIIIVIVIVIILVVIIIIDYHRRATHFPHTLGTSM